MFLEKGVNERRNGGAAAKDDQNANEQQNQNNWGNPPKFTLPKKIEKVF